VGAGNFQLIGTATSAAHDAEEGGEELAAVGR